MAQMPIQHKEIHSSSGTTISSLWDYINSLTEMQKDHLAINCSITLSGSTYTILVRRSLAGVYEGYNSSSAAISVYVLTPTQLFVRSYGEGITPTPNVATFNSWSASYSD